MAYNSESRAGAGEYPFNPAFEAHTVTELRLVDVFKTSEEVGTNVVINFGAALAAATETARLIHIDTMGGAEDEKDAIVSGTRSVKLDTCVLRKVNVNGVKVKMPTPLAPGEDRVYACTFKSPGGEDGIASTAWPEHVATGDPRHPMCHFVVTEGDMALPFTGSVFNPPPFSDTEEFCGRLLESHLSLFPQSMHVSTTVSHDGKPSIDSWVTSSTSAAKNFCAMAADYGYGESVERTGKNVSIHQADFIALRAKVTRLMARRQPFHVDGNVCLQIKVRDASGEFIDVPSGTKVSIDMDIAFMWQEWMDSAAPSSA